MMFLLIVGCCRPETVRDTLPHFWKKYISCCNQKDLYAIKDTPRLFDWRMAGRPDSGGLALVRTLAKVGGASISWMINCEKNV